VETRAEPRTGAAADFFAGMRLFGRGIGMYARTPRLLVLGLVPAVISAVIMTVAFAVLVYFISDLAALVTWFADDWSRSLRATVRVLAGAAILGLAAVLAVLTYTAITLIIGDPFYEEISKQVEQRYGAVPDEPDVPWWVSMRRNLVDSLRLLALTLALGVPMFVLGFIPLVGQTVVPVLEAVLGGWFLAVELTGIPFNRRGLRLRDRRRLLAANRALALGFGVPIFVIFLVPFVAVVLIPAAVAGSTLLARRVLGLPHEQPGLSSGGTARTAAP
jgi:CysZ protein